MRCLLQCTVNTSSVQFTVRMNGSLQNMLCPLLLRPISLPFTVKQPLTHAAPLQLAPVLRDLMHIHCHSAVGPRLAPEPTPQLPAQHGANKPCWPDGRWSFVPTHCSAPFTPCMWKACMVVVCLLLIEFRKSRRTCLVDETRRVAIYVIYHISYIYPFHSRILIMPLANPYW